MNNPDRELLADLDFNTFKRKVKITWGLDLEAYKRPQMERRLRANMEKCGAENFAQYYAMMQKNPKLAEEFLDRVTINVSELFRNPEQFEILQKRVLPELLEKSKYLSIWSAGCSYGAEPYTVAIILSEIDPGRRHNIHASDIDEKMLAKAQKGVFSESDVRNVPKKLLSKYFTLTDEGYAANNELKRMITFKKHDLLRDRFGLGYNLILCRNVVIYFTDEAKDELYRKFYNSLSSGGYLFVGGTERISNYAEIGFENKISFFYRKPERH